MINDQKAKDPFLKFRISTDILTFFWRNPNHLGKTLFCHGWPALR